MKVRATHPFRFIFSRSSEFQHVKFVVLITKETRDILLIIMAPKDDPETAALKKELNELIEKFQVLRQFFNSK